MKRVKGIIFVLLGCTSFGMMPVIANEVYNAGGNAMFLSLCRFAISIPLVCVLDRKIYGVHDHPPITKSFLAVGVCYILTLTLQFAAYRFLSGGMVTTLGYIYPAVVLFLCRFFLKERITVAKYACCAVCLLGVALLCNDLQTPNPVGVLLCFVSAVSYAIYVTFLPACGAQKTMTSLQITFRLNCIGTILMLIVVWATDCWAFSMTPRGWMFSVLLSLGTAAIGSTLFQVGIRLCGSQTASMLSTVEVLTSVIAGHFIMDEVLTPVTILGILLTVSGVVFITLSDRKDTKNYQRHNFLSHLCNLRAKTLRLKPNLFLPGGARGGDADF